MRLGQPAGAIKKTLGLLGHFGFLQVVDQLRRRLALCVPNRRKNAGLGDTAEIVVHRWTPPGLDHVEFNGTRQYIGLVKTRANTVGGDAA